MKKVFKNLLLLTAISGLAITSCQKDPDDKKPDPVAPKIELNNGATSASMSSTTESVTIKVEATADTDRKIKKISITRNVVRSSGGISSNVILSRTFDAKDVILNHIDSLKANGVSVDDGDRINYKVEAEDDKGLKSEKEFIITISSIATSPQILLGAPSNTTNEYRFFGVANNFRRYRAGNSGPDLARNNVQDIDFIYFFNSAGSVQNAIYSADFNFAAGTGWATEVSSWTGTKNKTLLKETDMSISRFNAITGNSFFDELSGIDFSTGTTDRLANLQAQSVLAFKLNNGKRGFLAVINTAANASGVITLVCKVEL
ncbi:MAG: hypothetical protein ACK4K9_00635 [Bacteroidia bacterium]